MTCPRLAKLLLLLLGLQCSGIELFSSTRVTSNVEVQSSNVEVQSSNVEVQSASPAPAHHLSLRDVISEAKRFELEQEVANTDAGQLMEQTPQPAEISKFADEAISAPSEPTPVPHAEAVEQAATQAEQQPETLLQPFAKEKGESAVSAEQAEVPAGIAKSAAGIAKSAPGEAAMAPTAALAQSEPEEQSSQPGHIHLLSFHEAWVRLSDWHTWIYPVVGASVIVLAALFVAVLNYCRKGDVVGQAVGYNRDYKSFFVREDDVFRGDDAKSDAAEAEDLPSDSHASEV